MRGFEFRPNGKWGKKADVGKEKLTLPVFLLRLANKSFPPAATIRCKDTVGTPGNGRILANLESSARLENLLLRIAQGAHPSVLAHIPPRDSVELRETEEPVAPLDVDNLAPENRAPSGAGYDDDPAARKVIETHAVQRAREYYERQGYLVTELGKPFDLLCQRSAEILHVEVKGSRSSMQEVILTANEVKDARDPRWVSDLYPGRKYFFGGKRPGTLQSSGRSLSPCRWLDPPRAALDTH
ncbi:DUF3883 domain-containing protein [uncultured Lamprocystis sp.]|uniref:protein NO VEIN domain-containing protein n=1 Tax=uncultured Lamprocystis sp. TaxID=543132 RepID=UPI0025CF24B2|nr:DUF3883 domain-containing protein [uncultured Lamprocystis sp.]